MIPLVLFYLTASSFIRIPHGIQAFSIIHTNIQQTNPTKRFNRLHSSTDIHSPPTSTDEPPYESPNDAIIHIKPKAMERLVELKQKRDTDPKNPVDANSPLILRMGVRNGGCSGLSYVMDFSTLDDIQEDDEVDVYESEGIQCVVDSKSLLYLYGLELDYSDDLIGGGFKFFNPNAEGTCGCGSSFGV